MSKGQEPVPTPITIGAFGRDLFNGQVKTVKYFQDETIDDRSKTIVSVFKSGRILKGTGI